MTLQESLDKIKVRIESNLPKDTVSIMHQSTKKLEKSGIGTAILKIGDKAPEFNLQNQDGVFISSVELLKKGPLVITFYRGGWCPYCNTDLAYLNRYNSQVNKLNGTLVSIAPQIPHYNKQIIDKQRLDFDLLSDQENNVANAFGLRWEMVDPLRSLYNNQLHIRLPDYNGDDSWTLPISSRFIIGTDGLIKYAEFSIDYTKRPNPELLIEVLKNI